MAGTLDEIAHGVVLVLATCERPEPLPVTLANHTGEQGAYLVGAVVDECTAAGVPLRTVRCDPRFGGDGLKFEGVIFLPESELRDKVLFFRSR